jgi:hypothetical protein
MSLGANVQIVVDAIIAASERRDWHAAQRLGERVRMIILDAAADRDRSGLSEAAAALEIAETILPVGADDSPLVRVGWMLKTDASLAKLAARRIPAQSTSTGAADRSARDRILVCLAGANTPPSVALIAKMSGLARETVSRLLPVMASEGLVRFRKIGRKTLSHITQKGRTAMGERSLDLTTSIHNVHGVRLDLVMMTSPSSAQKHAYRTYAGHAKPQISIDRAIGDHWVDVFAKAHEGMVDRRGDPALSKETVLQMIFNDGAHTGRDRVMEIPA